MEDYLQCQTLFSSEYAVYAQQKNWSERSACASGQHLGGHYFGPSEVRATSGQHLGGHYFAYIATLGPILLSQP
jgi:hypothetical protein